MVMRKIGEKKRQGGFRRIDVEPWGAKPCHHPEHNPPGHIVLPPGRYEYTCPGCGRVTIVNVEANKFKMWRCKGPGPKAYWTASA
jgi:hypothetical protein